MSGQNKKYTPPPPPTAKQLAVLRSIDAYDKLGPLGTFQRLTDGRTDGSGAFTEGCGLSNGQALLLLGFLEGGVGRVSGRLAVIKLLEDTQTGDWCTAWDELLALKEKRKPKNWAFWLDDIYCVLSGHRPPPSADEDWDWWGFVEVVIKASDPYRRGHKRTSTLASEQAETN